MPTIQQVTNKATKSHVDAFDGLLRELKKFKPQPLSHYFLEFY